MSVTTIPVGPTETELQILASTHMTAIVTTETGSRYTVVARPNVGVVLIHDEAGWATKGDRIAIINGRMFLFTKRGTRIAQTTRITRVFIMSN